MEQAVQNTLGVGVTKVAASAAIAALVVGLVRTLAIGLSTETSSLPGGGEGACMW